MSAVGSYRLFSSLKINSFNSVNGRLPLLLRHLPLIHQTCCLIPACPQTSGGIRSTPESSAAWCVFYFRGNRKRDCTGTLHRQRRMFRRKLFALRSISIVRRCCAWHATYIRNDGSVAGRSAPENRGHPKERHACQDQQSDVDFFCSNGSWDSGLALRTVGRFFQNSLGSASPSTRRLGSAVLHQSRGLAGKHRNLNNRALRRIRL